MAVNNKVVPLTPILKKLVPISFITGAAVELFMVKTGFYEIVTKAEAEKRLKKEEEVNEQ